MKNNLFAALSLALPLATIAVSGSAWSATPLKRIKFRQAGNQSVIEISANAPITVTKSENEPDKQVVLEIPGATFSKADTKDLDTSSFDSPVALVSPYNQGTGGAKIVVQLRSFQAGTLTEKGNTVTLSFDRNGGGEVPAATASAASTEPPPSSATDSTSTSKSSVSKTDADTNARLEGFLESQQTRQFSGRPITLQFRDAEIQDVFRIIGETSGFNILVDDNVKGKVTLSLVAVPWDQALDVILRTKKLGAERTRNVLRVVTLADLTKERQDQLAAIKANEAVTPKISRIFPISFAKLDDLVTVLQKLTGSKGAAQTSGSNETGEAVIVPDSRTNNIIVRDTAENVDRIRALIETLDRQTAQVLIEGKVVEATESFGRTLGGSLAGGSAASRGQAFASFAGGNPVDGLFSLSGEPSVFTDGKAAANAGTPVGGSFGVSPAFAFLPGNLRLNALLNLGEQQNTLRVVSSPRTVVLDKETSKITQSQPVGIPGVIIRDGIPVNTLIIQQAVISLDVSPTVTNEGSVLLDLTLTRDVPQKLSTEASAVGARNLKTRVICENGSTLVIGGIYTMSTDESESGFPGLRKIPILGWLFGSETSSTSRSELLFFVTPRILNSKEAGIAKDG